MPHYISNVITFATILVGSPPGNMCVVCQHFIYVNVRHAIQGRSWSKIDFSDVYIWLSSLEIQTYIRARIHYDNVTWAPRHLKSPETRQFIQSWTRLITKKIPQYRITGPFCDVMQNVFIPWRHNELILVSSLLGNRSKIMWTLRAYSCLPRVLHMTRGSNISLCFRHSSIKISIFSVFAIYEKVWNCADIPVVRSHHRPCQE